MDWAPFTTEMAPHALSRDGRFVVFMSHAALLESDTNAEWDIYLRDRQTNALVRVSEPPGGGDANGVSYWPVISSGGRYVAFHSMATNLVTGDDNNGTDIFVFDRELHTIVRVNLGPNAEQSRFDATLAGISGDGRYVAFGAFFGDGPTGPWLRDRDADGNGVFDEPEQATTTPIPVPTPENGERMTGLGWMTLSDDARYVAFTPDFYTEDWAYLGNRLYVHDRVAGATVLIGPANTDPGAVVQATEPDFGDGHLVYATNAPNLVPADTAIDFDVLVLDLQTGGHSRVQLTHDGAPMLSAARAPAISRDGRFVTFVGSHLTPEGIQLRNVYAVDRGTGQSYEISVRPDGARVDRVGDYPSISDDGSAIAFLAGTEVLVDYSGNDGVFVATSVAMAPEELAISPDGQTMTIEVTAPETTAWEVTSADFSTDPSLLELSPTSGVGSGTIDVSLPANHSGDPREYWVIVGSEHVVVRQPSSPDIWWIDPGEGSVAGGTEVQIIGAGFAPDATVMFGGQPATRVVVTSSGAIRAVTPSAPAGGPVDVVVTNGDGLAATVGFAFNYLETTAVEVPSTSGVFGGSVTLQATLRGVNGPIAGKPISFFVADLPVGSAVTNGSGTAAVALSLGSRPAGAQPIRADFSGDEGAPPANGSGVLTINRAPLSVRTNDVSIVYGQPLPPFTATATGFVNDDTIAVLSGTLTFATAATATSAPGVYPVTPSGVSATNYDIHFEAGALTIARAVTTLAGASSPNPSRPRHTVALTASAAVVAPGAGVPTGSVTFLENGVVLGAAPLENGVATLALVFRRGTHVVTARYAGDQNVSGSEVTFTHTAR